MAWRSSGTTNDEMVDNLKRFGVVTSEAIENGFRNVDRKFFVPEGHKESAHSDEPLKEGNIHISAPHIYGSALEALELRPGSALSFLNVGSGTGYLSCIVAEILGTQSLCFGVEIHEDVVKHSRAAIKKWRNTRQRSLRKHTVAGRRKAVPDIEIIHGNAFHISTTDGEGAVGFDRIYVGAAVDRRNLQRITKLLSPGGILVGPVGDELVKVVRIGSLPGEDMSSAEDAPSREESNANEFTRQVLSGVRFTPLTKLPIIDTIVPSRRWNPSSHQHFPDSFHEASMQLLLCSNAEYLQPLPIPKRPEDRINLAAMLPKVLWMEILSFTHRKWFEPQQTEAEFLRKRLLEEQANAAKAQNARLEAEVRCHVAERERDVYRLLARRWQSRLNLVLQQQRQATASGQASNATALSSAPTHSEDDTDTSLDRIMEGEERVAMFGLSAMLRQLQEDIDDDEAHNEIVADSGNNAMEEDEGDHVDVEAGSTSLVMHEDERLAELLDNDNDSDDEEYEFQSFQSEPDENNGVVVGHEPSGEQEDTESIVMEETEDATQNDGDMLLASKASGGSEMRHEIRTISISSDDL